MLVITKTNKKQFIYQVAINFRVCMLGGVISYIIKIYKLYDDEDNGDELINYGRKNI